MRKVEGSSVFGIERLNGKGADLKTSRRQKTTKRRGRRMVRGEKRETHAKKTVVTRKTTQTKEKKGQAGRGEEQKCDLIGPEASGPEGNSKSTRSEKRRERAKRH